MKFAAIIPARLNSTRLPEKLLKPLGGKTIIEQTYLSARETELFSEVFVVTDAPQIAERLEKANIPYFYSQKEHETGSDRIAEVAPKIDADVLVNIQGDEPFISKKALQPLLNVFAEDNNQEIDLATLMYALKDERQIQNPNHVKVVSDKNGFALYFSRAPIPYFREGNNWLAHKHIGIYAFRKAALVAFAKMEQTPCERAEKIECIRFLEHGYRIKMVRTSEMPISIDTAEDYEKAIGLWASR